MKITTILFALLLFNFATSAQQQTEYNRRGDEAMKRLNYRDAKIWYEEGIANCDSYSINQLTSIWLADESMRMSMRSVMSKCLSCLNDRATENKDTSSVKKLILYYKEGIGTDMNEATANFWMSQLNDLRNPYSSVTHVTQHAEIAKKTKMEFFVGYSLSMLAPFGINVGGIGKNVGWYLRFRTNMSFQENTEQCEISESGQSSIIGLTDKAYQYVGSKKANALMATGGMVVKIDNPFYISVGIGYWKRDVLYKYREIDLTDSSIESEVWAKHKDGSYSGLAIDLDGMFRIGKTFYGIVGVSACNFKYVYMNAGVGVFF